MADHTPTPWALEYRRGEAMVVPTIRKPPRGTAFVIAHVGQHAATEVTINRRDANAALIVKAVNSHDELLDLVKLFERSVEYEIRVARTDAGSDEEGARLKTITLNLIRDAIAKAERKESSHV